MNWKTELRNIWLLLVILFGLTCSKAYLSNSELLIKSYGKMSGQTLLDKGDNFYNNNIYDSALICYSSIYNRHNSEADTGYLKLSCKAINRAGIIYLQNSNYRMALNLFLKGVDICKKIDYDEYIGRIYNNIGNLYYRISDYNTADRYYKLASRYINDISLLGSIFNNLGMIAYSRNDFDSAMYLYRKSHTIKKRIKDSAHDDLLNNIAIIQESMKNYDSALLYYKMALESVVKTGSKEKEASILSNIGMLYCEMNKLDLATLYLMRSNEIAVSYNILRTLSDNYLAFSKIEEMKGNTSKSLEYYKQYSVIKDSIFNISEYNKINEMKSGYDMAELDKQIKELNLEQMMKEEIIRTQRKFQIWIGIAFIIVLTALVMLYLKNKGLHTAYSVLTERNMEIVRSDQINSRLKTEYEQQIKELKNIINQQDATLAEDGSSQISQEQKYKSSSLKSEYKDELLAAILTVMNDKSVFCNPEFTQNKLAEIVNSNATYVSQVINDSLKTNFRSFLNEYRMKEARKILSNPEYQKYSIEAVAAMVGFKSRDTFDNTFKKVIGVTPSFYLKSVINKKSQSI